MASYSAPDGAPVWFDLTSSDPDRAAAFYGELFGWEVEDPDPGFAGYRNFLRHGRRVAGLVPHMAEAGGPSNVWTVYFRTDDAQATAARIVGFGGAEQFPPMAVGDMGVVGYAVDPAGAAFGYWQSGAHTGFAEWNVPGAPYWFEGVSRDHAAVLNFYRDVFGARPEPVPGAPGDYTQLFYGDTARAGVLDANAMPMIPAEVGSSWSIYLCADDVAATAAKAVELGGALRMGPDSGPYGTLAAVTDPMGAMFGLGHEPAPPTG
ncbi:MAG: VOC family protein [Gordonia sp. (in: high G+C Gram-positive bacteria)]|uniref:VOC family protein n=1 Tax=Gordonia sp. (in: high G+C Gram-positive bacteria) TaxID=84139 RepID=UPI0039E39F3B